TFRQDVPQRVKGFGSLRLGLIELGVRKPLRPGPYIRTQTLIAPVVTEIFYNTLINRGYLFFGLGWTLVANRFDFGLKSSRRLTTESLRFPEILGFQGINNLFTAIMGLEIEGNCGAEIVN